jgi:hypothetical protein
MVIIPPFRLYNFYGSEMTIFFISNAKLGRARLIISICVYIDRDKKGKWLAAAELNK